MQWSLRGNSKETSHCLKHKQVFYKGHNWLFYGRTNQMHNISNLSYFGTTLYMFWTVSPSIIRSLRLYIQHQVYVIQVLWLLEQLKLLILLMK